MSSIFFFFLCLLLCWVCIAVQGVCLVAAKRGCSSSWCLGCSLQRLLLWRSTVAAAVGCMLSSGRTQAYLPHTMWALPGPGLEPVSPALAVGFLTTRPPEKTLAFVFESLSLFIFQHSLWHFTVRMSLYCHLLPTDPRSFLPPDLLASNP